MPSRRIFGVRRWNTLLVALGCALAGLAWGWVSGGYLVFEAADRQEVMRRLAQTRAATSMVMRDTGASP